ncbi:MAG: hypothetical protein NTY33_00275 [Candidatus Moranbacteria bacterium]|nr:hypothetical protein [Candidatus Moranbacteria bacterium]
MARKQLKEGKINGCKGYRCSSCCCDDDLVEEWALEFMAFHDRMKNYWLSKGIKIEFLDDRVRFRNCSDGKECKFITYSPNKEIDSRPIDCKIYPYLVDWDTIDFDKKIVHLYFWDEDCPLVKDGLVSQKFKKEIEEIIKYNFSLLFHGAKFEVRFVNKILKNHRFYNFKLKLAS